MIVCIKKRIYFTGIIRTFWLFIWAIIYARQHCFLKLIIQVCLPFCCMSSQPTCALLFNQVCEFLNTLPVTSVIAHLNKKTLFGTEKLFLVNQSNWSWIDQIFLPHLLHEFIIIFIARVDQHVHHASSWWHLKQIFVLYLQILSEPEL